jgi:lipopolysaccharide/colanic/teichoic acid biosynthesis glycosyltransferase
MLHLNPKLAEWASAGPSTAPAVHTTPAWKRCADFVIAGVLLVFAAPVMLAAMALVKLTSSGPAIYSQVRSGLNRRPFTIYKIRTMGFNCEAKTGAQWAVKNDPRITLVGRFLRATHIDELPQLINVLRGDMSLVGPRPERPEIIEKIEPLVPGYAARMTVRPGVTGLAQVQVPPDTDIESVRRKVRYDAYYAATASLWLDLRLIAATLIKVTGLPFAVSRALLWLPGKSDVEPDAGTETVPALGAAQPGLAGA